jgi:hypothetical protein
MKTTSTIGVKDASAPSHRGARKKASHEVAQNSKDFGASLMDAGRDMMAAGKSAGNVAAETVIGFSAEVEDTGQDIVAAGKKAGRDVAEMGRAVERKTKKALRMDGSAR